MQILAYAGSDMQYQHHVNIEEGFWPPGENVSIRDGQIYCELAMVRAYDLVESYRRDPHLAFLRLKTERELVSFIQTWGPLYRFSQEEVAGTVIPAKTYWTFQRWLKALVNLLGACKRCHGEREALWEFLEADSEKSDTVAVHIPGKGHLQQPILKDRNEVLRILRGTGNPTVLQVKLLHFFSLRHDLAKWLDQANLSDVRMAVSLTLEETPRVKGASLLVRWSARRSQIVPRWEVDDLMEALEWMVWHDEWSQHPLLFCQACREAYRPKTAHRTKYCTPECAHRVAARNWRRRDSLRIKRKRRRK